MNYRNPYTVLGWIAMLAVPLAPAFFFGFEFYKSVYTEIHAWIGIVWVSVIPSLFIGAASALGLELVGVLSGHTAIKFWERNDVTRAGICVVILLSYVILGIVGLESILTKGVVMFLVAPLAYLLVGMLNEMERLDQSAKADKIDSKQEARELRRLKLQYDHDERLAQIQASTMLAESKPEPAQSESNLHKCGKCQRDFATVQGLNAHQRFCAGGVPLEPVHTNGVQKTAFS